MAPNRRRPAPRHYELRDDSLKKTAIVVFFALAAWMAWGSEGWLLDASCAVMLLLCAANVAMGNLVAQATPEGLRLRGQRRPIPWADIRQIYAVPDDPGGIDWTGLRRPSYGWVQVKLSEGSPHLPWRKPGRLARLWARAVNYDIDGVRFAACGEDPEDIARALNDLRDEYAREGVLPQTVLRQRPMSAAQQAGPGSTTL